MTDTPESIESSDTLDEIACIEALLFASDSPLSAGRLAQAAGTTGQAPVKQAVETLNARYEAAGAAFTIEAIAGGFQMMTRPQYNDVLRRLKRAKADSKLSQAALETLAIVAYRQPILRADVEAIRGVACGEVLRGLLDKQLVKIVGRAEVIGRPMLYGTTRRFLEIFGLKDLDDLPRVEELRQPIEPRPEQADAEPEADSEDQAPDPDATEAQDADGDEGQSSGHEVQGEQEPIAAEDHESV